MRKFHIPDFFTAINQEIKDNEHAEWFLPYSEGYPTFENCRLKFLNGNLDYRNFQNMVNHSHRTPIFNSAYPTIKILTEHIRDMTSCYGPLGRSTIWNIPPGEYIKPHRDAYVYHRFITRWIYIVNQDTENTILNVDNQLLETYNGDMFELLPAEQMHSFYNNSKEPWYFLGIDFWNLETMNKIPIQPNDNELLYITSH